VKEYITNTDFYMQVVIDHYHDLSHIENRSLLFKQSLSSELVVGDKTYCFMNLLNRSRLAVSLTFDSDHVSRKSEHYTVEPIA
jgi:hypothetical protein